VIKNYCPKHWGARDPQDGEPEVAVLDGAMLCCVCGEPASRAAGLALVGIQGAGSSFALAKAAVDAADVTLSPDAVREYAESLGAELPVENVRQSKRPSKRP